MTKMVADPYEQTQDNLPQPLPPLATSSLTSTQTTDAARTRIVNALIASSGAGSARFRLTAWQNKAASAARSGAGHFLDLSTSEFADALRDDATKVVVKGEGPCFSMGSSLTGGSSDEECMARHGLTLDLDHRPVRSDGTQGWEPVSDALRAAGIAHVMQVRAAKVHIHIPFAQQWEIDASGKSVYKLVVTFLVRAFERIAECEFDDHEAWRLLGLVFCYTPRAEGETVETTEYEGVGLDLDAFISHFPDELTPDEAAAPSPYVGIETVYAPAEERILRAKAYVAKMPPAVEGDGGDSHTVRVCMVVARDFDLADDAALEALRPWNARCVPPWDEADLLKKIDGARKYGTGPLGSKCAAEERRPASLAPTKPLWTNRYGDPNRGPLVLFAPAKEGDPDAQADEKTGKFWKQIQPSAALLTNKVKALMEHTRVFAIRKPGTGNRYYDVLPGLLVSPTDEDGLRTAFAISLREMMGGMEPEPRTVTVAVQLLCDRARPDFDMRLVRLEGETCYALHEIPVPKEGDWSAHKEFIDRCSCPDTVMAWVWTCFLDENRTGRESLYLQGEGNDGKSYWAESLLRFLGPAATSSEILKGDNRFELANLLDRRLVLFGETRNPRPIHTKIMREVIAGAYLPFERKGKDVQTGYFHPRCLFTSNVHFRIDVTDKAEFTRIRKIIVSPLASTFLGDHDWKHKLLAQFPAFLWECRRVYERFATPGEGLPITKACHDALAGGSDEIDEEFEFLNVSLEFTGNSSDFITAKRLLELFKLAGYKGYAETNARKWMRSKGAYNRTPGAKGRKCTMKIGRVATAIWVGVREVQSGLYANVGSAPSPTRAEERN